MAADSTPLRILSLDGGGIRGMSSLLILEDIMEKIRDAEGLDRAPRPCEYFDFIGGTSTGGIIAIMLGRLGMSVDECIQAYRKVAKQAFTPKKKIHLPASPSGAFSAKALEAAIKQTVRDFCAETECVERRVQNRTMPACPHGEMAFRKASCTKTTVLAITKDNVDARPTLFTTYDTSAALHDCTIWEVARATSAATTFFKPIKVGRDHIEYIDAGFGYNNPCEVLVEEAQRQFPGRRSLRVLSIGTGMGDVVAIGNTRMSIIAALKKMATSSKRVAATLDDRYGGTGQYYRFNVDHGLQDITLSDWEAASKISAHTRNYLNDNQRMVKNFVNDFTKGIYKRDNGESSPVPAPAAEETPTRNNALAGPWYHIPFLRNKRFVGRGKTLVMLRDMLFVQQTQRVALVGLGGVGKTQVALQLALWTKENKADCSVFWVPALSEATFEQAYTDIANQLEITRSDDQDVKECVRQYLSSEAAGRWLLILDNADDMDVLFGSSAGIAKYLPASESGLTLFTTRSREVAVDVAGSDIVKLQEMDCEEAASLFRKLVIDDDDTAPTELLNELSNLPLAIVQAAAYLNKNQVSVSKYLNLLRGADEEIVSLISREFHDHTRYEGSQNAVATTWLVSFEQIRRFDGPAADLLSFISCIEPKAIPQSILPYPETEEKMVHAIGTLCGYAFLTRREEGNLLDMHSLVHTATRVWIKEQGRVEETEIEAIRHLAAVFPEATPANRVLCRDYLPHTLRLLDRSMEVKMEENYHLYRLAGQYFDMDRRFKEAISMFQHVVFWKRTLAEGNHSRLTSEFELAIAYLHDRRFQEAIVIFEHITTVLKGTRGTEDEFLLRSEHALASAYLDDRRTQEAIKKLEHLMGIRRRELVEEDPSRLALEHDLASAYLDDRRVQDAILLLEHVVAVRKRMFAEEDYFRLSSEHALASAYLNNKRVPEAIEILEHVVAVQKRTLAEDDHSRLASEDELARAYFHSDRIQEAIEILEHVVAIQKKILAEEDPFRLWSEYGLATVYLKGMRIQEAIERLEHVVAIRKKTLEEEDPDLLVSQRALAVAYRIDGQKAQAVALLKHIVAVQSRTLPEDHPHRLQSMSDLDALLASS